LDEQKKTTLKEEEEDQGNIKNQPLSMAQHITLHNATILIMYYLNLIETLISITHENHLDGYCLDKLIYERA
jgi:hypothetical protein